jgi:hypothetical protein
MASENSSEQTDIQKDGDSAAEQPAAPMNRAERRAQGKKNQTHSEFGGPLGGRPLIDRLKSGPAGGAARFNRKVGGK